MTLEVAFGVLGPVAAWYAADDGTREGRGYGTGNGRGDGTGEARGDGSGAPVALKGPRHRAVLARLIVARRRVVPVTRLVEDLWAEPPPDAVGALRTFVSALRRALEPQRPPRAPARLLVTEGPGYALRAEPAAVDSWRFEHAVTAAASLPPAERLARLEEALSWWRGPAYADFADEPWARPERSRLTELRLHAVERHAEARLGLGRAAEAVPDLDAHAAEHPWREDAWHLLALALYRTGRQADALTVLRRARALLTHHLGLDPGPRLRRLEADILAQADHLDPAEAPPELSPAPSSAPGPAEAAAAGAEPGGGRSRPAADTRGQAARPGSVSGPGKDAEASRGGSDRSARMPGAAAAAYDQKVGADSGPGTVRGGSDRSARMPGAAAAAYDQKAGSDPGSGPGTVPGGADRSARVWEAAAAAYDQKAGVGARARLESTVGLLRSLAVTGGGGLEAARRHRVAAVAAAEELGDAELTARVIGSYDVPAIWTRVDDPEQAGQVVAAAERTLAALPSGGHEAVRARVLATIALESRGTASARGPQAARQAEALARGLDDPALLAFALNGLYMQTCHRAGLAPQRDAIGAELVALSARHGLVTYEVLGHLVRLQARSALADFPAADQHAAAADRLAERNELPLAGVFTHWYRALRLAATGHVPAAEIEAAYRDAAARLDGAGMPGLEHGLLPLALLCLRVRQPQPAPHPALLPDDHPAPLPDEHTDWGPYEPWTRPLVLLAQHRPADAAAALRTVPDPPRDLLYEALWCLTARAAIALRDRRTMHRAQVELTPAATELAGAGSGLLTLGPVAHHLDALTTALSRPS